MRLPALVVAAVLCAGPAFGQTSPVEPNPLNFGPGKIDASTAYRYIGQTVTACGRATQSDVNAADLVMGVSPYETIILFPPGTDPQAGANYSSKVVCVTGTVEAQDYPGIRAAIRVQDPSQIQVTSYQQPVQRCGPCLNPNGTISGRACYGGSSRRANEPIPPC
jgi:hypothetical protein